LTALAAHLPRLRVPRVRLGDWPTPLTAIDLDGRPVWVKREGDSHPRYGGNKVRTLELWLGHAQARGARRIWAIGAYGSNHAIATVLHAPRAGLEAAAILFPQPASPWAVENCGALVASGCRLIRLRSVVEVPFAAWQVARRERDAVVMPPGGATPIGTLGAMAAAFELADQIAAHAAPPPRRIVVAVGSTCTAAGLLAGLALARALGVWRWPLPIVHGVRVTPWPVTSRWLTAALAWRTLARVEQLGGPRVPVGLRELVAHLVIDGRELGPGYGRTTPSCEAALRAFARHRPRRDAMAPPVPGTAARPGAAPRLDGVYSGKAAAALLRLHRTGTGPLVFWATKSTAVLPPPDSAAIARSPPAIARWLADA
jgi:D-cysteine desulfhydrase